MSNTRYRFDGGTGVGTLPDGTEFMFDADQYSNIKDVSWYRGYRDPEKSRWSYIVDHHGRKIHEYLMKCPSGMEIDHINKNTLDNRRVNLRICTHQQNQCNQPLQRNNTSGVTGVSYYPPRGKFRARIKVGQHDIHLGYYNTFLEAVQARNVGMECMFGEYGDYNDAPPAPDWIREKAYKSCERFADLAVGGALFDMQKTA